MAWIRRVSTPTKSEERCLQGSFNGSLQVLSCFRSFSDHWTWWIMTFLAVAASPASPKCRSLHHSLVPHAPLEGPATRCSQQVRKNNQPALTQCIHNVGAYKSYNRLDTIGPWLDHLSLCPSRQRLTQIGFTDSTQYWKSHVMGIEWYFMVLWSPVCEILWQQFHMQVPA